MNTSAHSPLGRAEARSPGLLILSSLGGQKALEPLSQRRSGRGIRKCVAAPKTKTNETNDKRRERKRGKQRASGQPSPETQERPRNGGARPQKKNRAQRAGRKNARQILVGRGKTPPGLREKAAPKHKRKKTCPPKGQKNQPCPVWKPVPDLA